MCDDLIQRIRDLSSPFEPIATGVEPRLAPLGEVRAVLLDVYGTLFLSGSGDVGVRQATDSAAAMSDALRDAGVRGDHERAAEHAIDLLHGGIEDAHAARRAEGVEHPEVDIRAIWRRVLEDLAAEGAVRLQNPPDGRLAERLAVEYECRVNPVWPAPGLADMLGELRDRGMVLGIVSNAQFFTPLLFDALLGAAPAALGFDENLCIWSYTLLEAKPSGVPYRRALDRLRTGHGIDPARTLYLGNDMRNDIAPAAALGCRTALYAADRRSLRLREDDPACAHTRPDAIVADLRQVPRLLSEP